MSDKSEIEAIRAVKRYTQPCVQQQLGPEFKVAEVPLFESAKGKYVLFTDYAVLLSHLDEQAKRIAELEACVIEYWQAKDWGAVGAADSTAAKLLPADMKARAALAQVKP